MYGILMARKQSLNFDHIKLDSVETDIDLLYFLSGKKMYEVGAQSGEYPPLGWRRPGFLVGKPITIVGAAERPEQAAHLLNEMGGIWAHPIKVLDGFYFSVTENGETWQLRDSQEFVYHLAYADFIFERQDIRVVRTDFVVEDAPAMFSLVHIVNQRNSSARLKLNLDATIDIIPSWFSGLPNGEDTVIYDHGKAVAYDNLKHEQWAVVFGANLRPEKEQFGEEEGKKTVTFTYGLNLGPGEEAVIPFLFVAETVHGYSEAIRRFDILIDQSERLLEEKIRYYKEKVFSGVRFECSDPWYNMAFYDAKANLVMLMTDVLEPVVKHYLYAGIPEYVQFFGTDTVYSVPGLMAVNYWDVAGEALRGLAHFGRILCGRIPHEITTNGHVFHPGNTQETPQFTIAAWNYIRWTGDRAFLEEVYPVCAQGVLDYVPAHWDYDLDYYPDGSGVVERSGMGSEKLDCICYFTRALYCLADMAGALGGQDERTRYQQLATGLKDAINADWWNEEEGMYADSLDEDHGHQHDGHWIVAVPMETELVEPWERAHRALERIRLEWVNEYGMVHTREKELFVWTLPTGVLAMGTFAYGDPDFAVRLLRNITQTIETGTLGAYKELIPEGLSFMQLWSPAMYLQGLIEGLFGLRPWAVEDFIAISPRIPSDWQHAKVEGLRVGDHEISVFFERQKGEKAKGQRTKGDTKKEMKKKSEKTSVEYLSGRGKLRCSLKLLVKGEPQVRVKRETEAMFIRHTCCEESRGRQYLVIDFEMEPSYRVEATYRANEVILEMLRVGEPVEGGETAQNRPISLQPAGGAEGRAH